MALLPPSQSALVGMQFNEWLFQTIEPYLNGRVLEVGSDFNTLSSVFVQRGRRVHLSTSNKALREQLKVHYQGVEAVRKVHSINFHRSDFEHAYSLETASIFDTILILNPMENGTFDDKVVQNARYLLKEKGRLILLTPIFTAVYNGLELKQDELKHYDRPAVKQLLTDEMGILATRYFHLPEKAGYDRSGPSVLIAARKTHPD
jgi:SAM-dependent methyltransferase